MVGCRFSRPVLEETRAVTTSHASPSSSSAMRSGNLQRAVLGSGRQLAANTTRPLTGLRYTSTEHGIPEDATEYPKEGLGYALDVFLFYSPLGRCRLRDLNNIQGCRFG